MQHHHRRPRRGVAAACARIYLLLAALPAIAGAASFTVSTLADSGPGSLRDAVDQANRSTGADSIGFGALSGTITLTSGAIDIFDDLAISGPGAARLTISGNGTSRIFHIALSAPDAAVFATTISGLSLVNATTPDEGGAIFVDDSNLTVDGCVFRNNSAQRGGGLYAFPSGQTTLVLRNTLFDTNNAGADGGGFGAQDIDSVVLDNLTVTGNSAARSGGGGFLRGVSVSLSGGSFSNNLASTLAPGVGGISGGGALRIDGSKPTATVQIDATRFTANRSQKGQGGALWLSAMPPETGGIVAGAQLDRVQADGNNADLQGGAIYLNHINLTLARSTLAGNTAQQSGGGIAQAVAGSLSLENATLSGNSSVQSVGGAIHSATGTVLSLASSTLAGNSATSAGGVRRDGSAATLRNTIIANNNAATAPDIGGAFNATYTLVKNTGGGSLSGSGNLPASTDPLLEALAMNGGATTSLLPAAGSPALNAGDTATAGLPATDQRGRPRISGGRIDIGAVERQTPEEILFRDGFQ
jgi:hypothetical protein